MEYKDYGVRYSIFADTGSALESLKGLQQTVTNLNTPMQNLANSAQQVANALTQLKTIQGFTFRPEVDTTEFQKRMKYLVSIAQQTAVEIQQALYGALQGRTPVESKARARAEKFGGKTKTDLQDMLKQRRAELKRFSSKLLRDDKGNQYYEGDEYRKAAESQNKQRLIEVKQRRKAISRDIQELEDELAARKALESKQKSKQVRSSKSLAGTRTASVTPASIKAWKDAFGDAKSRTLRLTINARDNGALLLINQVKSSLNTLANAGSFTINPVLNPQAFAQVESQLTRLAALSGAITKPFGYAAASSQKGVRVTPLDDQEKKQLAQANRASEKYAQRIANVQKRLEENRIKNGQSPTAALKGAITRDTNLLNSYTQLKNEQDQKIQMLNRKAAAIQQVKPVSTSAKPVAVDLIGNIVKLNTGGKLYEIPVNAKILPAQILESIKAVKVPNLSIPVRLAWGKGDNSKQAQLQRAVSNVPTIKLMLDASNASRALEEFVAKIKSKSPQTIAINATTKTTAPVNNAKAAPTPVNVTAVTPKPVAKSAKPLAVDVLGNITSINAAGKTFEIPVAAKVNAAQIVAQLKAVKLPQLTTYVKLAWEKGAIGKNQQLKSIQQNIPPIKLTLDVSAATATLNEFISTIQSKSPQTIAINATATNSAAATTTAATTTTATTTATSTTTSATKNTGDSKGTGKGGSKTGKLSAREQNRMSLRTQASNTLLPFVTSKSQMDALLENRKFFKRAAKITGIAPTMNTDVIPMLKYLRQVYSMMKDANAAIPVGLKNKIDELQKQASGRWTTGKQLAADKLARDNKFALDRSLASKAKQAEALRAKAYNSVLPFVRSKSEADMVLKNRKFFKLASLNTGITPYEGMSDEEMLKYLRGVSGQMRAANVPIPMQLQSSINDLHTKRLVQMREDAKAAFSGPTPYEQRLAFYEKLFADKDKADAKRIKASRAQQASRLRAQAYNSMLPFAANSSQANTLVKYRKFFRNAAVASGITPTPDMSADTRLQYLNSVAKQMQKASVAIPWQLQSAINNTQKAIEKMNTPKVSRGGGAGVMAAAPQKPFYDRLRKFAYPFTGNTSFGARTPMAVDMAKGMGVMFAIGGAMSAIGGSFGQSVEYQNVMETTKAILKNSDENYSPQSFANMERIVRNVGISTKFSAPEVANAAKFLAMAGSNIETINNSIRPIADLALIGDLDLGETADKMTNIMKTFQIDPKNMRKAANIMVNTFTRSNTDLMMLAESAKYGGGVAQMYGYNNPNTFADTMALFGIMGNSGIQGSAAGTALRMIYRNIFSPNKNQAAILKYLETQGVKTRNEDKSYRALSEMLIDMANIIPRDQMADVIGKLFRITAQPGANAVLTAAVEKEGVDANEVNKGLEAIAQFAETKGLSELAKLMQSNRDSANGTLSIDTAKAKQNTMQGLWAQVTSTFTEGILQAFEKNIGYFERKLKILRDALAAPQTAETIKRLFDLLIGIGEMMAKFAGYWIQLYNSVPKLVKAWIIFQMFFTQLGSLILPFNGLIAVLSRLHSVFNMIIGAKAANSIAATTNAVSAAKTATAASVAASTAAAITSGAASAATSGAVSAARTGAAVASGTAATAAATMRANQIANGVILSAPMIGAGAKSGLVNRHARVYQAGVSKWEGAIGTAMYANGFGWSSSNSSRNRELLAASDNRVAVAMANKAKYEQALAGTADRMREIDARRKSIYGAKSHSVRGFNNARTFDIASLGVGYLSFKNIFANLAGKIGSAVGLLLNPLTLALSAFGVVSYKIFQGYKRLQQKIEDEKFALSESNSRAEEARRGRYEAAANFTDTYLNNSVIASAMEVGKKAGDQAGNESRDQFKEYEDLLVKVETVAGAKDADKLWNQVLLKHQNYRVAFGDKLGERIYDDFQENRDITPPSQVLKYRIAGTSEAQMYDNRIIGERRQMKKSDVVTLAGASAVETIEAQKQIVELRKQLMAGKLTQDEYDKQTEAILKGAANVNAPGLFDASQLSAEDLQNRDWRYSIQYQQGILNVLQAEREGRIGTISAYLQAEHDLKNGLLAYSKEWYDAISRILMLRQGAFEGIKYQISMMPDGTLDFSEIERQLKARITGFTGTIEKFATISASVYAMLLKLGIVQGSSYNDFYNYVEGQVRDQELTKQNYSDFYDALVKINPTSREAEMGKSKWMKEALNGRDQKNWAMRVRQFVVSEAALRQQEEYLRLNPNANNTVNGANKVKDNVTNVAGKQNQTGAENGTGTANGTNTGAGTSNASNQEDYAANYSSGVTKPTQIVINIDKLASFDRTTVAASSEEKDLMAAMESRIADAVYRIFAEAANQATQEIQIG